jgi:hypothetical protein
MILIQLGQMVKHDIHMIGKHLDDLIDEVQMIGEYLRQIN